MLSGRKVGLALLAAWASVAAAAAADPGGLRDLNLCIGVYRDVDGAVRDNFDSGWLDVTLGYRLQRLPGDQRVEVGWIKPYGERPAPEDGSGAPFVRTTLRINPVIYTLRTRPAGGSAFYCGVGAGAYFVLMKGIGPTGLHTFGAKEKATRFGVHGLLGYVLTRRLSLELRYTDITAKVNRQELSGFSLSLCGHL